jgi:hypothetical protein
MSAKVDITDTFGTAMNLRGVLTTPPPALDFVLPGLLAGDFGVLVGPGGVGKTMLELHLAVALATGTPACGGLFEDERKPPAVAGRVVFVATEESEAILHHRLHAVVGQVAQACGLDRSPARRDAFLNDLHSNLRIYALDGVRRITLLNTAGELPNQCQPLMELCPDARLVFLDPLRQLHEGEENNSFVMNRMVQLLRTIAKRTGAAIVAAHHANRASVQYGVGDLATASRGSTALPDGTRWQLNLSRPTKEWAKAHGVSEDDKSQLLLVDVSKTNYSATPSTVALRRLANGALTLDSLAQPESGGHATARGARRTTQLSMVSR